ncbi:MULTISPECIES: hypothetical protein [unclassified Pedobacter]|uniref:hypothetical protein n=1 Tax=unclassified Pedobacter TaxID=2628915 RepID=UPI0014207358|nr:MULTISPECIES: hypothetical protein [unclassified Pedobacter]NII83263.1 hypothetical protein [Pedobacter sp. SG908]NMN37133.1 hypothetical protein [Pedobacter sp. SG918]
MKNFYKILASATACLLFAYADRANAQDQTINGNLNIGAGFHNAFGYGPRIYFLGNSDDFFISHYNSGGNQSEFRFGIGDDFQAEDKFAIGVTYAVDNQWYDRMVVQGDGNVGIGTSNPDQKLTIKGGGIGFDYNSADKKLYSPQDGELEWMTNQGAGYHGFAVSHQGERRVYLNVLGDSYINGGNLGIGTTSPKEKLSVNGKIRAHEIKIETANWPDYVFEEGYNIETLKGLESYIKMNKHLPEIPTAKEVETNGVALGEMNKLLLKKVEELTLHLIEKEKEIKEIKTTQAASDKKAAEDLAAVLIRLSALEKSK